MRGVKHKVKDQKFILVIARKTRDEIAKFLHKEKIIPKMGVILGGERADFVFERGNHTVAVRAKDYTTMSDCWDYVKWIAEWKKQNANKALLFLFVSPACKDIVHRAFMAQHGIVLISVKEFKALVAILSGWSDHHEG